MREPLILWQGASCLFFLYTIVVALLRGPATRRRFALVMSATGLAVTACSVAIPRTTWLHDWLLPPSLLLLGYWSSGALFTAPMSRAEAMLMAADRKLGISNYTAPRVVAELLEAAYLSVYAIVGIAFVLHLVLTPSPSPERFWAVVLITDFICFAMLPWIQTRPPRAIEDRDPWRSSVRRLNLRLLGATSIHANTFPSGHAAEAIAAALLVVGAPVPVVCTMFVSAVAISAGAVLGRYHYALDALAGWLVAVVVWLVVT